MKLIYSDNHEQGVVSILSVIFFIILMSILTVSFLRIVTDEQTQVENDDLSKGALQAAQSGVEDAKRALLYCRSLPFAQQNACYTQIRTQTCPGMFSDPAMRTALGLNQLGDGSIQVGAPNNSANQRYTCVTIKTDTKGYEGPADEETLQLIPLRGIGAFNKIQFSWRQSDPATPAPIPTPAAVPFTSTPRKPQWKNASGTGLLPVARLQLFNFDHSQSLTAMRDNSVGMFLFPYAAGTGGTFNTLNVSSITPGGIGNKHVATNCGGAISGYRCTMTLTIPPANASQEYYMAVKSVYDSIYMDVQLFNGNTPVSLDNVQPEIDSTGATANVYKRVITRVAYQLDPFLTTNVIESGAGVCKDFYVTRTTAEEDGATVNGASCLGF